jgi:hypothetical protein
VEDQFGGNAAFLREVIPQALVAAHVRARQGHDGAGLTTLDVYGHGLAVVQFEEMANWIAALDGARMVKLHRYYLAVLNGWVFYPWRYADDNVTKIEEAQLRRPVSMLRRRLFAAHGPEPRQPALDESLELPTMEELHQAFPQLGEDTRLCVIPYACSVNSGVLNVAWGEAELHSNDGSLTWHRRPQPLPLPSHDADDDMRAGRRLVAVIGSAIPTRPGDKHRRFDAGPQPNTPVIPRTNLSPSPVSESQPTTPKANNYEDS